MSSSCFYDCAHHPHVPPDYSDISGIGVILGYTGTAGIVVLIVTFYYLTTYDPSKDPFREKNDKIRSDASVPFRPNPVDVYFAKLWKQGPSLPTKLKPNLPRTPSLENAYIKCVLSMSDLQIFSGISILISGFVQLRCGLSSYHWQLLVYLAYFSSLSHLACLTILRHYLYHNRAQRIWRLTAMSILIMMLLVALVSTSSYDWGSGFEPYDRRKQYTLPQPSDYAICHLQPGTDMDRTSTITSMCLLGFGFVVRVVRLHKCLSVDVVGRTRQATSKFLRLQLRKIHFWCNVESQSRSLKRTFVYRPLLALFLTARISLDVWSSMFLEVWSLLLSFTWGVTSFFSVLLLYPQHVGSNSWTFGQVIPVVLLAAPLLAISEYMLDESKPEKVSDTTVDESNYGKVLYSTQSIVKVEHEPSSAMAPTVESTPAAAPTTLPFAVLKDVGMVFTIGRAETSDSIDAINLLSPGKVTDNPDHDFANDSPWYRSFTLFVCLEVISTNVYILIVKIGSRGKAVKMLTPQTIVLNWFPIAHIVISVTFVLHGLLVETWQISQNSVVSSYNRKRLGHVWMLLIFLTLLVSQVWQSMSAIWLKNIPFLVYIIFALMHRFNG